MGGVSGNEVGIDEEGVGVNTLWVALTTFLWRQ